MTLREDRERAKTSREELGKFFYSLAKMSFGIVFLGSVVALVTETASPQNSLLLMSCGLIVTAFLASIGFKILNLK
nr:hypothetical protein [Prevotella sp.]